MTPETPLAELALQVPAATQVFHRHGLDFCCNGKRSLAAACESKGLDPRSLLEEIESATQDSSAGIDWTARPLGELADHIVNRYHEPLREELPRLLAMARKVERVHADKASCPRGLAAHLETVHAEVSSHLDKEEQVLFPMIRAGQPAPVPVQVMTQEHDEHAANLRRTRELTHDFVPPAEACTTWRALLMGLETLERELMEHIHLENHVLFPRSLSAASAAGHA